MSEPQNHEYQKLDGAMLIHVEREVRRVFEGLAPTGCPQCTLENIVWRVLQTATTCGAGTRVRDFQSLIACLVVNVFVASPEDLQPFLEDFNQMVKSAVESCASPAITPSRTRH